ncbi:putative membrane protein-like [Iris pallida]|uniref:Membrane protein-like n=1 Tax=Iris pallida TaxID=29817 RepID=A0AAX6H284_IRIPA|nr:putative membrane protein-like [Iris pallida]
MNASGLLDAITVPYKVPAFSVKTLILPPPSAATTYLVIPTWCSSRTATGGESRSRLPRTNGRDPTSPSAVHPSPPSDSEIRCAVTDPSACPEKRKLSFLRDGDEER